MVKKEEAKRDGVGRDLKSERERERESFTEFNSLPSPQATRP